MSGEDRPGAGDAPLEVFVYYDFASCLSYVAHRVLARIDGELAEERIELRWKAIDLTGIGRFQRGRLLDAERRRSLIEVASALKVELDPPARWPDSRLAGEVALALDTAIDRGLDPAVEREWRQAAFAAFYEQVAAAPGNPGGAIPRHPRTTPCARHRAHGWNAGVPPASDQPAVAVEQLFRNFERRGHFGTHGVASLDDLAAGRRLAVATRSAAAAGVEGAPTLMFDAFPLCGIHDEATMLGMIQRYARRRRRPEAETAVGVN